MDINLLFRISLICILLLSFLFIILFYYYRKLIKGKKEFLLFEGKLKEAEDLLSNSRIEAGEIIKNATLKSQNIINSSNYLQKDVEGELEKTLQDMFSDIKRDVKISFEKAASDFSQEAKKDMVIYSKSLLEETQGLKGVVTEGITEAIKNMERELDSYRTLKEKEIDEEVKKKVDVFSKQILGKAISDEDHFKLVMDSINKITKEK